MLTFLFNKFNFFLDNFIFCLYYTKYTIRAESGDYINDSTKAFLVKDALYDGIYEMPILNGTTVLPNDVILFSDSIYNNDYNKFVVFYEQDYKFERIWNNPKRYLKIMQKFKGVISPDFSLYRNMPLSMQIFNTYKNRAIAHYYEKNNINVIPNIRFSDTRSYDFCFDGVPKNGIVAIGTLGCIKRKFDKIHFKLGLDALVQKINPRTIIVYGAKPIDIFQKYENMGINIVNFESKTSQIHKKVIK